MSSVNLLVVHPERIVRESLAAALQKYEGIDVVGVLDGCDSEALTEAICGRTVDVVLLDSVLAQRYGRQFIETLRSCASGTRTIVTGVADRDVDVLATMEAGVEGYQTKESSLDELVSNVKAVMSGRMICSLRIARHLFSRIPEHSAGRGGGSVVANELELTRRQLQILELIEIGWTNKEIARALSLEVQTVKNHVHNILDKLNVHRRLHAVRVARLRGLISQRTTMFVTSESPGVPFPTLQIRSMGFRKGTSERRVEAEPMTAVRQVEPSTGRP